MRLTVGKRYLCRVAPWKTICVLIDKLPNSVIIEFEDNPVHELQTYTIKYFKDNFEMWKGK